MQTCHRAALTFAAATLKRIGRSEILRRYLWPLLACLVVGGCATYGQDRLFDTNTPRHQAAAPGTKDTASVYVLTKIEFLPSPFPLLPFAYAMDNRLLSIMPSGTYIHLQVPAGSHTFSRSTTETNIFFPRIKRSDVRVELQSGKTYFVGSQPAFGGPSFGLIDETRGPETLKESKLARMIYAPTTMDKLIGRLEARNPTVQTSTSPASNLADVLPTQEQISGFFEVVATVALIGLFILGAGAIAASGSPGVVAPPIQPAPVHYSGSRRATQVTQTNRETTVRDTGSGVVYTVRDGAITGSDGSRYRVSGTTVFSSTGEYYQKIGNTIYGNDGSSCTITGSLLDCKTR